jgi:hypothetical protein
MNYLVYTKKKWDRTDKYKLVSQTLDKEYHDRFVKQLINGIFHDLLEIKEIIQPVNMEILKMLKSSMINEDPIYNISQDKCMKSPKSMFKNSMNEFNRLFNEV